MTTSQQSVHIRESRRNNSDNISTVSSDRGGRVEETTVTTSQQSVQIGEGE